MSVQTVAHNVRRLRVAKRLSQKKLADAANVSELSVKVIYN